MRIKKLITGIVVGVLLATTMTGIQPGPANAVRAQIYQDAIDVCDPSQGPFSLIMRGVGNHKNIWGTITLDPGEKVTMHATHLKDHSWSGNWSGRLRLYYRNADGTVGTRKFSNSFSMSYRWNSDLRDGENHSYTNNTSIERTYYVNVSRTQRISISGYENARTDYDFVFTSGGTVTRVCTGRQSFGQNPATKYVADPINTATGRLISQSTDIGFNNAFGLTWTRFYNSGDRQRFAHGRGWVDPYATNVRYRTGGSVELTSPDGTGTIFMPDGAGGFYDTAGFDGTLSGNNTTGYQIDYYNGDIADFDLDGRLETLTSWTGESITITRNTKNHPTSVVSSTGQSLTIAYNAAGRVEQITTSDGRSVSYTYNSDHFLTSFTDVEGGTTLYTVDAYNRILTEHDPQGVLVMSNTYDIDGRVLTQTTGSGEIATFAYDIPNKTTTATFSPSGDVFTYIHNGQGRTISVTDSLGGVETFTVDNNDNNPEIVDSTGETITQTFDADGFLLTTTKPGVGTTTNTWDTNHRLLTTTAPTGAVTTNTYTGSERIPTTTTNALGGVTSNVITSGLVTETTDPDGVTTTYTYDTNRRLTSRTDELGNTTAFTYDGAGRLLTSTTPLGHVTTNTYDAAGRLLTTTDPTGGVTTRTYNTAGQLLTITDAEAGVTAYTYDTAGHVDTMTDSRGHLTSYTYDDYAQLTSTTRPGSAVTATTYGDIGRVTAVTDPLGRSTSNAYDSEGRQTSLTDAAGETSTNTYGTAGRIDAVTDPLGRVTTYNYDSFGRNTGVTLPDGTTNTATFDLLDRPISVTDASGGVTAQAFTPAGRSITLTDAVGAVTTVSYDAAGRAFQTLDANGQTWTNTLDIDGQITSSTSPEGLTTTYTWDAAGRQTSQTDPNGITGTITYNSLGQPTQIDHTGDGSISTTFDSLGALSVTNAIGGTASFSYDSHGNITTVTDQAGQAFNTAFNTADQPTSKTDPLGRTTVITYDSAGRPASTTDASGVTATSSYDAGSQLTTTTYSGGQYQSFTYDAAGRIASVTSPAGTQSYTYDNTGSVTSVTETDGDVISYEYDLRGLRTAVIYPDGTRVDSTYDTLRRLASVTHPTAGTITYGWDNDSRPTSVTFADGTTRTWAWSNNQVTTYQDRGNTWNLTYDSSGRLSATTGAETWALSYDNSGRLTTATVDTDTWTYVYDSVGNITSTTDPSGSTRTYTFDAANQLTGVTDAGGTGSYTYNAAGRLTQQTNSDATTLAYNYDLQGRLTSTVTDTGVTTSRSYDPGGLLATITRTNGAATDTWDLTWDRGPGLPQLLTVDGPTGQTDLIRGESLEVSVETGGTTVYDHGLLGDITSGPLAVGAGLSPYGDGVNSAVVGIGHRGELHVDGLIYLRNRNLDTRTHRFTTTDILSPVWDMASTSTYQYAAGNPINYNDPSGLRPTDDLGCHSNPSSLWFAGEWVCRQQNGGGTYATRFLDNVGQMTLGVGDFGVMAITGTYTFNTSIVTGADTFVRDPSAFRVGLDVLYNTGLNNYHSAGGGWRGWAAAFNYSGLNPAFNIIEAFQGMFIAVAAGDLRTASTQFTSAAVQSAAVYMSTTQITARFGSSASEATGTGASNAGRLADDAPTSARFCSFSGETEVLMADGTTRPISEIEVGDWVLAQDPETGGGGAREVTHLWVHQDTLIDLEVDGHEVATTEDHPFWNHTDGEWQRADALDSGDLLLAADGNLVTVDGMDWGSGRTTTAYNLTVDGIHTYFVQVGGDEILVHNVCPDIPGRPFTGRGAPQAAFDHLEQFSGLDPLVASNRLHVLKTRNGIGAADDVAIGRTGDVYDAVSGDLLGNLTDPGLGTAR